MNGGMRVALAVMERAHHLDARLFRQREPDRGIGGIVRVVCAFRHAAPRDARNHSASPAATLATTPAMATRSAGCKRFVQAARAIGLSPAVVASTRSGCEVRAHGKKKKEDRGEQRQEIRCTAQDRSTRSEAAGHARRERERRRATQCRRRPARRWACWRGARQAHGLSGRISLVSSHETDCRNRPVYARPRRVPCQRRNPRRICGRVCRGT